MARKSARPDPSSPRLSRAPETAIVGRLDPGQVPGTVTLEGYLVVARREDRLVAETTTDGNGVFHLRLEPADVNLEVNTPDGRPAWRATLTAAQVKFGGLIEVPVDPALGVPDNAEPKSEPARSWQVVDAGEIDSVLVLVRQLVDQGMLRQEATTWITADVEALEHLYQLSVDLAGGSLRNLDPIVQILRGSPPWILPEDWRPVPEPAVDYMGCLVRPNHPYAFLWAGLSLAVGLGDPVWVDRAVGYYLEHANRLNLVHRAATGVLLGDLRLEHLAEAMHSLAPSERLGGLSVRRSLPPLDELDLCTLDWLNCAYFFWKAGPIALATEPQRIGGVQPNAVCSGYNGKLRLLPRKGETFSSIGTGWDLAIGGVSATILQQTPGWIDVQMPSGVPEGCTSVGWLLDVAPTAAYANQMRAACQRFLGAGTWMPPFVYRADSSLTVVGQARIVYFYAAGQTGQVVAEACTFVDLAWTVTVDHCQATTARAMVSLLADGNVVATQLGIRGIYRVAEPRDVTYTLRVETFAGKKRCHYVDRSVIVKRYHLLRAGISGQVSLSKSEPLFTVEKGSPFSIEVQTSCPAPSGGTSVTVTTSKPTRLAGGTLNIPQGSGKASFAATAQECGEVLLQVSSPGHQAATLTLVILDTPQVGGFAPVQVNGCAPFVLTITVHCAGGPLGSELGDPEVIVQGQSAQVSANVTGITPNPQDPFRGPTQIQAKVPGLQPGIYTVAVRFRGKSGVASVPIQVSTAPPVIHSFTGKPSAVISCIPDAIQLSWDVEHASQLKLFRDGTQIASLNRTPSCSAWTGNHPGGLVDREREFRLDAIPQTGGPIVSRAFTVKEQHGIYSIAGSITLTNKSSTSLYIWSVNSIGTAADLEDLLSSGQSTMVTIPECLRINLVAETSGDERQLLKSVSTWRWSLAMLGRAGEIYPPQTIY